MQLVTTPLTTGTGITNLSTADTLWENTPPFRDPIITCTVAYIASSAFRERNLPVEITYGTYFIHLGPSVRRGGDFGLIERFSESTAPPSFFPACGKQKPWGIS